MSATTSKQIEIETEKSTTSGRLFFLISAEAACCPQTLMVPI